VGNNVFFSLIPSLACSPALQKPFAGAPDCYWDVVLKTTPRGEKQKFISVGVPALFSSTQPLI